jgi:predicted RNA binding protein YcfA (HicA-like mRNA interferase family)
MGKSFKSMKAKQLESIVRKHCKFLRQKHGSHRIYQNAAGHTFAFAFHRGDEVGPRLVLQVLTRDVGLTREEAEKAVGI